MSTPAAELPVFHDADFPNGATHRPQSECGFSIYKGILIQWDEDHDLRILTFIDELPDAIRGELLIAQEHESNVSLVWKKAVPAGWEKGRELSVDFDIWYIVKSSLPRAVKQSPESLEGEEVF